MNIAVFNEQRYEFVKGSRVGEIILLSNTWHPDFQIEKIDGMEFYARHIDEDDTQALWNTDIKCSFVKNGPKYNVAVLDTHTGDALRFEDIQSLPEEVNNLIKGNAEDTILLTKLKESYPDITLWKVKEDYYDDSVYAVPITTMEAISQCVKLTRISARKTILDCGNCGFHFPYMDANIAFGQVYSTRCPMCDSEIVKKRTE